MKNDMLIVETDIPKNRLKKTLSKDIGKYGGNQKDS